MSRQPAVLPLSAQVAQARNMSIGDCITLKNIRICVGKKPIVSVTYENGRISIKDSLPYLKYALRLSCVDHGLIYGRFMAINQPVDHTAEM